ncbi:hypothetical protein ACA910_017588 [Epithemia clementina (nom. ined.)]
MGQCRSKDATDCVVKQPHSPTADTSSDNDSDGPSLMAPEQAEYYIKQCDIFLNTLTTTLRPAKIPNLSKTVMRWDWSHDRLTGRNRDTLIAMDIFATAVAPEQSVESEHKIYQQQPLGRSMVQFQSVKSGDLRTLYIEFTFNDEGEISFVEVWPLDKYQECIVQDGLSSRLSKIIMNGTRQSRSSFFLPVITMDHNDEAGGTHQPNVEVELSEDRKKRMSVQEAFAMQLQQPPKQWFESTLQQTLDKQRKEREWKLVLQDLKRSREAMEEAGRIYGVDLMFPPEGEEEREPSGDAAAEFASAAVRTLIFGSLEKLHRTPLR